MAGTLRGIITGMIRGIVIVPGGLTHPGMVLVGDSAGAGEASTQVGAVLGMAVIGAEDITVAAIGGTIITIIIIPVRIITDLPDVLQPPVILLEEILPVAIVLLIGHLLIGVPIGLLL